MQTVAVAVVVAVAAIFIAIRVWKTLKPGKKSGGCGKCDKCG